MTTNLLKLYAITADNNDCCTNLNNILFSMTNDLNLRMYYTTSNLTSSIHNEQYLKIQSMESLLKNIFNKPVEFSKSNIITVKLYLSIFNDYIKHVLIYEAFNQILYTPLIDILTTLISNIVVPKNK